MEKTKPTRDPVLPDLSPRDTRSPGQLVCPEPHSAGTARSRDRRARGQGTGGPMALLPADAGSCEAHGACVGGEDVLPGVGCSGRVVAGAAPFSCLSVPLLSQHPPGNAGLSHVTCYGAGLIPADDRNCFCVSTFFLGHGPPSWGLSPAGGGRSAERRAGPSSKVTPPARDRCVGEPRPSHRNWSGTYVSLIRPGTGGRGPVT